MGSGKRLNPWNRSWFFYYAHIRIFNKAHVYVGTVTKRLDPVSYHFIKWYHGEDRLVNMAYAVKLAYGNK